MIAHTLDTEHSILHIQPQSALAKADFEQLALVVDPYIAQNGKLAGLIVEVTAFPGWKSLGAMIAHLRFVREHHKLIKRVAIVTDSALGDIAEHLASHFAAAEIRHFPATGLDDARQWISSAQ
jgi:hypothetical protein